MASAADGTNPSSSKDCVICGDRVRDPRGRYRSIACSNRGRTDHSSETLMRRFWKKVDKTPGYGPAATCWRWTGRVDGRGYGEIKIAGRYKKSHRLALFGPDDMENPLLACHRCDNPLCVRKSHLYAGASVHNVHDMLARGRSGQLGRPNSRRKLSSDQVRQIRASTVSERQLAVRFGVSRVTVSGIRARRIYRDVT